MAQARLISFLQIFTPDLLKPVRRTLFPQTSRRELVSSRCLSIYRSTHHVAGSFARAVSLPDDVDPGKVNASYRDGVLQISIARREAAQPKRIVVQ